MSSKGMGIREMMAALGVVASLIFVGWEIRQNTRALQAAAVQEMTGAVREQFHLFINNPELNSLTMRAEQDITDLTPDELRMFDWVNRSGWFGTQSLFRQWELGALPDDEWGVWQRLTCEEWRSSPGVRARWPQYAPRLLPRFVALVESCGTSDPG